MEFSIEPSFKELQSQQYIQDIAFRLLAIDRNRCVFASGTCFTIAHGALVTAKHVIEDFLQKFHENKREIVSEIDDLQIWAIQILNSDKLYAIWEVKKMWLAPISDIALLSVVPLCENAAQITEVRTAKLNLFPPPVGSRIVGFGYHNSCIDKTNISGDTLNIIVDDNASASVGEVMEIHTVYRDRVRLNFPCFRVNARFDGGMSGGPVFNDDGEVCGIICSSLPADEECSEHISYVTSLWPLMGMKIDAPRSNGHIQDELYPVLDLARDGIISVNNWERVAIDIFKNDISYLKKEQ